MTQVAMLAKFAEQVRVCLTDLEVELGTLALLSSELGNLTQAFGEDRPGRQREALGRLGALAAVLDDDIRARQLLTRGASKG